jgi:Tfp pilus assembly protein PilV
MSPNRSSGFTLMETLVSLIVLGFIIGGLAQALRFGMTAWDRQVGVIDRDSALDSTNRILRMLLSRMAPGDDPHVFAVNGDADRLSFTVLTDAPRRSHAGPGCKGQACAALDAAFARAPARTCNRPPDGLADRRATGAFLIFPPADGA